jgi:hypothetical protein
MPTLGDIAVAARAEVYGFTTTQEPTTYLAADLASNGLTLPVINAAGFSRGIVGVDDELMLVDAVDRSANTLTLTSVSGRGIRGTEAAAHPIGATVVMSPVIPLKNAKDAVAEALRADSGLFAVSETIFPYQSTINAYALPVDFRDVLMVQWLPPGPDKVWQPIRRWNADRYSRSLVLGEAPVPGYQVRVVMSVDPIISDFNSDFTDTGLPESCVDVIRWSAAWRLTSFLEPYLIVTRSAESDARDRANGSGSKLRTAQYLYQIYQTRLAEEVGNLQRMYPSRVHFSGTV